MITEFLSITYESMPKFSSVVLESEELKSWGRPLGSAFQWWGYFLLEDIHFSFV